MLAYVFWHRPRLGVESSEYEAAQRDFHASLVIPSACFRIAALPFGVEDGGGGYEDWYLAEDWAALGELNVHAIEGPRRGPHDHAASLAREGWGALYELARGVEQIPEGVEWRDKPRGESSEKFISSLPHASVWRRQLVLGPAAEFCCGTAIAGSRNRL